MLAALRSRSVGALGLMLAAGLAFAGCNTGTTPGLPAPDFQAPLETSFPIRVGDLGYVQSPADFLYISVLSVGADNRCPPGNTCREPGSLELALELETSVSQGSIGIQVPPSGKAVGTYQTFEIRIHEVTPPGRVGRILPTEYVFLMSVGLR